MRKLLKKHGMEPRVMVTDKMKSYAAKRETMPGVECRRHKGLNNLRRDNRSVANYRTAWVQAFET